MVEQPSPQRESAEAGQPHHGPGARAGRLCRALVPIAAAGAIAAFGWHEQDGAAAAEASYLGLLSAATLASAAMLDPMPAAELGLGAVLLTAAFWALPPGPSRGAAVTLLLVAAWTAAACRRLATAGVLGGHKEWRAPLALFVPLALGSQFLMRGELLLPTAMSWRGMAALLVLPVAGAAALAALARRHGVGRTLTAAAAALVLAPGFTVTSTLALAALAAGSWLAFEADLARLSGGAAGGSNPAAVGDWSSGRLRRGAFLPAITALAALAVVLAPLAWQARLGAPFHPQAGASLCWLVLVVPGLLLPSRPRVALAAVLLAAAMPWIPDRSALAAPLALAALALPAAGPLAAPQRVWSATLAIGTMLLSSYPWLRADPLGAALALTGANAGPWLAASVAGAVVVLTALGGLSVLQKGTTLGSGASRFAAGGSRFAAGDSRFAAGGSGFAAGGSRFAAGGSRSAAGGTAAAAGGAVFVALLVALPGPATNLLKQVVPLDQAHPSWETDLPAPSSTLAAAASGRLASGTTASLVVDSNLTHAAGLANGAAVAVVSLRQADGERLAWTLRAGEDTGEWAARRPDVAANARLRSPTAWLSWVDNGFVAQQYRAVRPLPAAGRFVHVRIERAPRLPADVGIALYQVELRP